MRRFDFRFGFSHIISLFAEGAAAEVVMVSVSAEIECEHPAAGVAGPHEASALIVVVFSPVSSFLSFLRVRQWFCVSGSFLAL